MMPTPVPTDGSCWKRYHLPQCESVRVDPEKETLYAFLMRSMTTAHSITASCNKRKLFPFA